MAHELTSTQVQTGSEKNTDNGRYTNIDPMRPNASMLSILKRYFFEKSDRSQPQPGVIPVEQMTAAELLAGDDDRLYRLGHSSLLLRLDGEIWLTDPVLSKRAAPVQWAGPKRFHELPIQAQDLPAISGVLISHNHYDHLDKTSIRQLHDKVARFLVPEGVAATLIEWGVAAEKIQEFRWWESAQIGSLRFTSTPAQHFSGRGLFDRDATLWMSWVIETPTQKIFFSGDSGYFSGFKTIGAAFGPFDLALMETGAYDPAWPGVHMTPEETWQAYRDLNANRLFPIHNSTFDLALHAWFDPLERLATLAESQGQSLVTPRIGAPLALAGVADSQTEAWWRPLMQ
ncbi:MBL fold metallo-hydrolase [Saccharospirillum mangrovi]|uniref:MBL fold metallo-hydrolase n=1 Tax=Saccharospirillum mangrovi TaxID=2161747 RepID=UPI000D37FDF1|nr:MBL fold metallo-hydrolase [Saccharospirillum mangrovi]